MTGYEIFTACALGGTAIVATVSAFRWFLRPRVETLIEETRAVPLVRPEHQPIRLVREAPEPEIADFIPPDIARGEQRAIEFRARGGL